MNAREHAAMRDMVVRSLLVAAVRSDRSEERPRKRVNRPTLPVAAPDVSTHRFVIPVVNERLL